MPKDSIKIDFSKEEEGGGGRVRWKPGDYHVQIVKVKKGRSSEKDTPFVAVTFKCLDGKKKGQKLVENIYLTPKSLKRLRLLLEAVGLKVPKRQVNIKFEKLLKKKLWIEVQDDNSGADKGYSVKSTVTFEGFMSEEDYEADPEEDEDEDEDDDEDDDDEDEEEEDDEDEDEDEDEDDEDEEDEDEEEEEKPKKKSKSKKSKSKSKSKKKSKKKDDDLEELDLDEL